jgi:hypothetical protein
VGDVTVTELSTPGQALVAEWDDRLSWHHTAGSITASEILRGSQETGFVVVAATAPAEPTKTDMQAIFRRRVGHSADPVLLLVEYEDNGRRMASLLGPTIDAVPVSPLEGALAERIAEHALTSTSPTGLNTEIRRQLASLNEGETAGLRNEGLLASHVLDLQPSRAEWGKLCERSVPLLTSHREQLFTGLGYEVEVLPDGAILKERSSGQRRAAAMLLAADESFDNPLSRLHGSNAVTHGLALARRENVAWLIVRGGRVARLFPVDPDAGVGRKGQTQTYVELDLGLLTDDRAGYVSLLLAPDALVSDGTLSLLLEDSKKYATGLSERLRDRIYQDVIPTLAEAVAECIGVPALPKEQQKAALNDAYHQAMIVLFRLLFVAYAEDRSLLPLDIHEAYTSNALKTLGRRILKEPHQGFSATSTSLWADLEQVWDVIDSGDLEGMGVPAYNGGLFTRDAGKNRLGAATYRIRLTNAVVGPVLRGLLIDTTRDGTLGMVDFRSLDVREFGTIYEGLLESSLGVADTDLALDANDTYVPAKRKEEVLVQAGDVYFHSRAGTRKATGSYFTKPFAVQHLMDHALEPSLTDHLDRVARLVQAGRTGTAATALFDFRVADLAMGSAHFLVAAIDRIEARFSTFLSQHPLPEVAVELHTLRTVAAGQLRLNPAEAGVDDSQLLRRQIARRCIYGVDVNEIAVELARLAVWIHTFVPGLPLSFLDHGLIHGNSLTGVGTLAEITTALADSEQRETKTGGTDSVLLQTALADFMDRAGQHLDQLGSLADASIADVSAAAGLQMEIEAALEPLAALCDLITAERTTRQLSAKGSDKILLSAGGGRIFTTSDATSLELAVLQHPQLERAKQVATSVQAAHLPVRFPEVLRRECAGFDVILGNPPWEKMKVEEHGWWAIRFPGLRSMSQQDKNSAIKRYRRERPELVEEFESDLAAAKNAAGVLTAGPYPGIGATDVDLFAAFCWRFWHEVRDGGRIGVVLPRTAMSGSATAEWRRTVLEQASVGDLTTLTNTARWAFDMEPRYTIALLCLERGSSEHSICLRGPFATAAAYRQGMSLGQDGVATIPAATLLSWSGSASIPLVAASDVDVFATMRRHPQLDADVGEWHFRPHAELHTTKEKRFYDFDLASPKRENALPVWTGGTFNMWAPGSGAPYAYADPEVIADFLQTRRLNQARSKASAFHEMPQEWLDDPRSLPMLHPRIAFRDVCRATDSRTMICALVPGGVGLVHKAPYLLRQQGRPTDEAFLLGVISSHVFDWITRRYVEIAMTFELLNAFPVPRVDALTGFRLGPDGVPLDELDLREVHGRVVKIAGSLAAVDNRYASWAAEVGVKVGSVSATEKDDLTSELDALVALIYGLSRVQTEKLFATFHRGWNHQAPLGKVLAHYTRWAERIGVAV